VRTSADGDAATVATRFALAALATWRVTHLLAEEDGPADAVFRLRKSLGSSLLGELMDCFGCLSIWVAMPASRYVVRSRRDVVPVVLALSGAACLLERAHRREPVVEPVVESIEGGRYGVLRAAAGGAQGDG
jgi:uncharacterized membrane protein